jgi:hypothetical protein
MARYGSRYYGTIENGGGEMSDKVYSVTSEEAEIERRTAARDAYISCLGIHIQGLNSVANFIYRESVHARPFGEEDRKWIERNMHNIEAVLGTLRMTIGS